MPTIIYHPRQGVAPEYLDRHLARGWRVTGQSIYNCNFLRLDSGEIISVLPTRLSLYNHRFSKGIRKLMRRNLKRFKVVYSPADWPEVEEEGRVNEAYMAKYPDKSTSVLQYHAYGERGVKVFNTWQIKVYDGDLLIAFSYLDLGRKCVYSKAGIYDPAYANHSLGLFTMGLEIEFSRRKNIDWYYPGYVSEDTSMFNYKHRVGPLEFYDLFSKRWIPYADGEDRNQRPLHSLYQILVSAQQRCAQHDVPSDVYCYPYQDLRYSVEGDNPLLDTPIFLLLGQSSAETYLILLFDTDRNAFELRLVAITGGLFLRRTGKWNDTVDYFFDPLRTVNRLATSTSVEELLPYFQLSE